MRTYKKYRIGKGQCGCGWIVYVPGGFKYEVGTLEDAKDEINRLIKKFGK